MFDHDQQSIWEAYKSIKINWDRKNGAGATPTQTDIDYFGFTTKMTYNQFRSLVPTGNSDPNTIEYIKTEIEQGKPIAPPFLIVKWLENRNIWQVIDHEGRSRSDTLNELGINVFPVDIIPQGMRARHVTSEMKSALFLKQR